MHGDDQVALRLVTWNVAGRLTRQPQQAAAVASLRADVVALQEVTARTLPMWRGGGGGAGGGGGWGRGGGGGGGAAPRRPAPRRAGGAAGGRAARSGRAARAARAAAGRA